jgi:hypothetical protein
MKLKLTILSYALLLCGSAFAQLQNGAIYKIMNTNSMRYAQTGYASKDAGATIHLFDNRDEAHFKWKAIAQGSNYYKFQNIHSNLYLGVEGSSKTNYGKIIQKMDDGSPDLLWKLNAVANPFKLLNYHSNRYLAVEGGSKENGALLIQWDDNGQKDILWQFELQSTFIANTKMNSDVVAALTPKAVIKYSQWQPLLNFLLSSLEIRINNFTPKDFEFTRDNTYRWQKPDDCLFKIGFGANAYSETFNLAPMRQEPFTIYVNALNKDRGVVSHENGKIKLRITFEQADTEIRTNCIDNFMCGGTGNPNFNIVNPAIEILIKPVIANGQLSYSDGEVRLFGDFNHDGFNLVAGPLTEVANWFGVSGLIRTRGAQFMTNYLNRADIKATLTTHLNSNLARAASYGFSLPAPMSSINLIPNGDLTIY